MNKNRVKDINKIKQNKLNYKKNSVIQKDKDILIHKKYFIFL